MKTNWIFLAILMVLSSFSTASWGQSPVPTDPSPYAGIYFGTFSGSNDDGQFGILVRTNGIAIVAFYDEFHQIGGIDETVVVNPDGSFAQANIDGRGTSVSGSFTGTTVTGEFDDGSIGDFSGSKVSNFGILHSVEGYYRGTISGTVSVDGTSQFFTSGPIAAIVGADGSGFAFVSAAGGGYTAESGGFFNVDAHGNVSGTFLDGTVFDGTADVTIPQGNGTVQGNGTFSVDTELNNVDIVHSGTWSIARLLTLPNSAPMAVGDSYTMGARLEIDSEAGVLSNDSDPEGDPLIAELSSGPSNGTLILRPDGSFEYSPVRGFKGTDNFAYIASDGLEVSNQATVTITVKGFSLPWLSLLLD